MLAGCERSLECFCASATFEHAGLLPAGNYTTLIHHMLLMGCPNVRVPTRAGLKHERTSGTREHCGSLLHWYSTLSCGKKTNESIVMPSAHRLHISSRLPVCCPSCHSYRRNHGLHCSTRSHVYLDTCGVAVLRANAAFQHDRYMRWSDVVEIEDIKSTVHVLFIYTK